MQHNRHKVSNWITQEFTNEETVMNIAFVAAIIVAPSAYSAGFGGYVGVSGGGTEVKRSAQCCRN